MEEKNFIDLKNLDHYTEESISEIILKFLQKENVRSVFGMQGGYTGGIGDKFNDFPDIRFIRCQHEEGAAFMADGYAKATGKFGALLVTAGPSLTNTITGVISSLADNTPVLIIAGAVPKKKSLLGAIQDLDSYGIDISQIFRECTRFRGDIFEPETFMQVFMIGVKHLFRGKKGPVLLNIGSDVFSKVIKHNMEYNGHGDNLFFDADAAKHALYAIKKSKHPVIFVGNGVKLSNAQREVEKFANRLKIPVITSPKGKSSFNNESEYYLGAFGAGTQPIVEEYLKNEPIDTVIALGTSFNEYSSNSWNLSLSKVKVLVQVDIDPFIFGRSFQNTIGIVGDCASTMRYMNRKVAEELEEFEKLSKMHRIQYYKEKYQIFDNPDLYYSNETPIKIPRLLKDIYDSFEGYDVNIFNDNGSCIWWLNHYMKLRKSWQFYSSLGFSSMGYAIPASIGGACGRPDKITIAVCGDGAAIMNGNEIKTAAEYNIAVFFFILNDAKLGIVHNSTRLLYGRPNVGTEYKEPIDFVKFAESLGVEAYRIDSPGQINSTFIQKLAGKQKPVLFDCRVSSIEAGPYEDRIRQVMK